MHDELLTPDEMGHADRLAADAGVPTAQLMAAAGRAVARAARRFGPCRTLVACGPGNNGGDGRVAARLLAQAGWPVTVATIDSSSDGSGRPLTSGVCARAELVIDAVFGAGLSRDVPEHVSDALAAARRVLAVDVPSGLDGGTGQARGRVRAADLTVTFVRRKPGHLLLPGRALCGEVVLADIGLPDAVVAQAVALAGAQTWRNGPALWRVPPLDPAGHKYSHGHVTVLGGAAMTGAARLSATAARRGGAGMVSIAAAGRADVYRAGDPGIIVTDAKLSALLTDSRRHVWVCGPGLGLDTAREALPQLLAAGRAVVADADALGAFAGAPDALRGCAVLTPHAGEFERLFGPVGDDKLAAARGAARRVGAVVLLKGADTVVAAPDGRAVVNDSAPPWLATAGAGDVLSGLIAALLARGMPAWEAACAGAWLHGRAGALAGAGLIAEELPDAIRRAICALPQ